MENESGWLLKRIQENEQVIGELEPRLVVARERLFLYRKLYELKTGKGIISLDSSEVKPFKKKGYLSIPEATKRMLEEYKKPLHGREIFERLPSYESFAKNVNSVQCVLAKKPRIFKNVGKNMWILNLNEDREKK